MGDDASPAIEVKAESAITKDADKDNDVHRHKHKYKDKHSSKDKSSAKGKSKDKDKDKDRDRGKDKDRDRERKDRDGKRRRDDSRERGDQRGNESQDAKRSRRSRSRSKERATRRDDADASAHRGDDGKPDREAERRRPRERTPERRRDGDRARSAERATSKDRGGSRKPEEAANNGHAARPSPAPAVAVPAVEEAAKPLPPPPKPAKKAEPLSLEELVKKREAEALAASKPVFLSKKQREELALKRRQEEVAAKAAAAEAAAASTSAPRSGPPGDSRTARDDRGRPGDRSRLDDGRVSDRRPDDRGRLDDRSRFGRRDDRGGYDRRDDGRDARRDDRRAPDRRDDRDAGDRSQRDADRERQKELEMIKAQYLGGEKKKKKVLKGAEKFKFNFDWAADDDTSRDLNPLYNQTHESALLFGRGLKAGVDRREQKKEAAAHEAELLRKVREKQGVQETQEDRQRDRNRQAFAEGYERANMKMGLHWKDKKREDMTERDWRIFREDYNITYKGAMDKATLPIRNWAEANLPSDLIRAVEKIGYTEPSPIQMAAIPLGLQFRDVIGVAETGSGKTAAFVLPMLTYILKQPVMTEEVAADGPYAVIMAPTRELAQQIEEEALKMAQYTSFRFVCIVGGQSIEDQGFKLRKGCEVIIATPGRLIDCLEQRYAVLNQCNYIVLDEADRMIDLGFEPQVIGVMDAMPTSHLKPEGEEVELEIDRLYRTTYMFSATMPPSVERLARKYLRRPVVINIGSAGKAVDHIVQRVQIAKENEKAALLQRELTNVGDQKVVVFVNTKRQCDNVASIVADAGFDCTMLHGGKSQDQREEGLKSFRDGTSTVLVATDVAGRGIDVADVVLVVNYDMPNNIENYTHRIGRTGRAGRKGTAVTFLSMGDTEVFYDLKKFLEESRASVPPQLASHEASRTKPGAVGDRQPKIQFAKK